MRKHYINLLSQNINNIEFDFTKKLSTCCVEVITVEAGAMTTFG
jgi:hypothetical protein